MFELPRDEFEQVVSDAVESLPEEFKAKLDNVFVVVEDYPPRRILKRLRKGAIVFGLYQGIPSKRRGPHYGLRPVQPDKISLYKKNIEHVCSTREEVYARIRKTLLHEIGHHFSLSDPDLRNIGW
jgi:predicted Zn-dependent protease with MMP-like domain